jgi:prolyl-tRNA synthetase
MFRKGRKSGIFRNNEANFFIEGHSAHSSRQEVDAQVLNNGIIIDQVLDFFGLPVIKSERPIWTNKPIAEKNFGYDAILPNGETALAASNYAQMQIFSKVFEIGFHDNHGNYDYTYQSAFGFSFRPFLFSLWILSDAHGLRLLPSIAPSKVVILEINPRRDQNISNLVNLARGKMDQFGIKYFYDCDSSLPINKRCAKWEMMGIPLRLEIGARELNSGKLTVKRRDNFGVTDFDLQDLQEVISNLLDEVEKNLRQKLTDNFLGSQVLATTSLEIIQALTSKKVVKLFICYSHDCINGLQKTVNRGELLGVSKIEQEEKCIFCNQSTHYEGWFARRI